MQTKIANKNQNSIKIQIQKDEEQKPDSFDSDNDVEQIIDMPPVHFPTRLKAPEPIPKLKYSIPLAIWYYNIFKKGPKNMISDLKVLNLIFNFQTVITSVSL